VFRPKELGGLPAPSSYPWLNGRNSDSLPFNSVQNFTSWSSTAKWTRQRPKRKRGSRGSRSRLYCCTASSTVCLVRRFFSSKVETGRPLTNRQRSNASFVASLL